MGEFLNEQAGRMLLAAAIVATIVSISSNRYAELAPIPESDLQRPVRVKLDKAALALASAETYFVRGPAAQFVGADRCVFEKERKVAAFVPVELDIPPASVARTPQLLPEPGPSLSGTKDLKRFGDEFGPAAVPAPSEKPGDSKSAPAQGKAKP